MDHKLAALEKARSQQREMREQGIKCEILNPVERAQKDPKSLRKAVSAKCYQCEGEDADPHVRWRIGNCLVPDCALYAQRPYQHLWGTDIPKSLTHTRDASGVEGS